MRRIDWRSFARNDRLSIKLYREEIRPTVDILLDVSASMAVTPAKLEAALGLAWFFWLLAHGLHADVRVWRMGARLVRIPDPLDALGTAAEPLENPLPQLLSIPAVRRGGLAILISDLLFPAAPAELAAALGRGERAVCIQLLSEFEAAPPVGGFIRLEEAESGACRDVALDERSIKAYLRRLHAWRDDLSERLRRRDGTLVTLRDSDSVEAMLAGMTRAGVIEA